MGVSPSNIKRPSVVSPRYDQWSTYVAPFGVLALLFRSQQLCQILLSFDSERYASRSQLALNAHELTAVVAQLDAYFADPTHRFELNLHSSASSFRKRLQAELANIPVGETRTYSQLAQALNSSPRAVGQACRHNEFPLIFPCHRVLAKRSQGGFAGETQGRLIDIKQWLLQHESA